MTTPRVIADDLFAGAGGWDIAAAALGIEARGVELMPEARATRDAAGLTTVHDDVWTFAEWLDEGLRSDDPARFEAALQMASPPCQTFSMAGKGSGRKALDAVLSLVPKVAHATLADLRMVGTHLGGGDERTALVLTPLWYALRGSYRHLAWEQVPAVLPVWEACAEVLREAGWSVWTGYLHAEQYGVPQTRKRAFLIASLDHEVHPPKPTHSKYHNRNPKRLDDGVLPWVSMAEGLGWGLLQRPAFTITGGSKNASSGVEWGGASTRAVLFDAIEDPEAWRLKGELHLEERINNQSGTDYDLAEQIAAPANTLAGRDLVPFRGANANRFNGSTKSRNDGIRITVAEAAVLQSFPADWPFEGKQGKRYLQVGNAVPPLLVLHVLKAALGHA